MNMHALLSALPALLLSLQVWAGTYIGGDIDYDQDSDGDVVLDVPGTCATNCGAIISTTVPAGGTPADVAPSPDPGCTKIMDTGPDPGTTPNQSRHTVWVCDLSSAPSTVTFAIQSGSFRILAAEMLVWNGVNPASYAIAAAPGYTTDTSGTISTINHPSVDVPSPGGVVAMIGHWDSSTITPSTFPSGYTLRHNQTHGGGPPTPNVQYAATNEAVSAGSTGALTFTFTANGADKLMTTVALADAGGGGPSANLPAIFNHLRRIKR